MEGNGESGLEAASKQHDSDSYSRFEAPPYREFKVRYEQPPQNFLYFKPRSGAESNYGGTASKSPYKFRILDRYIATAHNIRIALS